MKFTCRGLDVFLLMLISVRGQLYLSDTEDGFQVEYYDCFLVQSLSYCRRPDQPIDLLRDTDTLSCQQNGGKLHPFSELQSNKTSISTIFRQWKSGIERVEQYSRYQKNLSTIMNGSLCQCTETSAFGKNCEYRLPVGKTFEETLDWQLKMRKTNPVQVQIHSDIVCYKTLNCDSGQLCLDWREICDGVQNCLEGRDEENCDLLEMNRCDEETEYRCMNGMCIPQEYFLDGERDCLDWSDEIQSKDGKECATEKVSDECDDRQCPPDQWSCGDGECIPDRLDFQRRPESTKCHNRRDQSFMCETHYHPLSWTMPNGRCHEGGQYKASQMLINANEEERCLYLLRCTLSRGGEVGCPCSPNASCAVSLGRNCSGRELRYPQGAVITSYLFFSFKIERDLNTERRLQQQFSIDGTIRCRHSSIVQTNLFVFGWSENTGRFIHDRLCQKQIAVPDNETSIGSEQCHHRNESTDICNEWNGCLSVTRMKDGMKNCLNAHDEANQTAMEIEKSCWRVRRHRFRCSNAQATCFSIVALGDGKFDCDNRFDEFWLGSTRKVSQMNCNDRRTDECFRLRQYIEQSSSSSNTEQAISQFDLSFRSHCDTFWDLDSREDENLRECQESWICASDQWRCPTGHCIDRTWILDFEWDCPKATDEVELFDWLAGEFHRRVSISVNRSSFLSQACNQTNSFVCLIPQISPPQFYCIDRSQIGDGKIDCTGAIEERNTLQHCSESSMLGYNYQCASSNICIPYFFHCREGFRCPNRTDDDLWCSRQNQLSSACQNVNDFICFNGTCVPAGRCDRFFSCPFSEDEYMCDYSSSSNRKIVPYREEKKLQTSNRRKAFNLPRFPTDANLSDSLTTTNIIVQQASNASSSFSSYRCNRGIGILSINGSIICFCPPQYFGDQCQSHNDRLSVVLHLNLSQSIYNLTSDPKIVLKLLVLFFFDNQTLMTHEFPVRPALTLRTALKQEKKKRVHLLYSHSSTLRQQRTERYFNRAAILAEQPYSVQMELYEIERPESPSLRAVWKYPIYFDYLSVFRFSKVLHLPQVNEAQNPCVNHSCHSNGECHPLLNKPSVGSCLCKANFTGVDCSREDKQCLAGYCAEGSLCKPNYRRLLRGNLVPYCLCPAGRYGDRCDLEYNSCECNPCQNGASCFPEFRPDRVFCSCTEEYYGSECQWKKSCIRLSLDAHRYYAGAAVQFFDFGFSSLDLYLVHQRVYQSLPGSIEYSREERSVPSIVLAKLYSSHEDLSPDFHLLSVHAETASIDGRTPISEINRCSHVSTLIKSKHLFFEPPRSTMAPCIVLDASSIRYHSICRENSSVLCFRDNAYLCICVDNRSRVECFLYDSQLDQCSHCLAGGRCLKGDETRPGDFLCLCPPCHSGANCQFSSRSFTFTLDQLFYADLTSSGKQGTMAALIIFPLLVFFFALPNNLFSFVTLSRRSCLQNGIGHYLLWMSVINQLTLALLTTRLIHLSLSLTASTFQSSPIIGGLFCKFFSYLLTCSIRLAYWLSSFVSLERVYTTVFINKRWLKQPLVARRLMVLTFGMVFLSSAYELALVKSFSNVEKGHGSMCLTEFATTDQRMWIFIHQFVFVTHLLIPLLINIGCTCTITSIVIKTKMRLRGQKECKSW